MTARNRAEERRATTLLNGTIKLRSTKLHVAVHEIHGRFTVTGGSVIPEDQKMNLRPRLR